MDPSHRESHETTGNIVSLYSRLEAKHAFKDGTSRTNHLVLNKLLAEHGLSPAVLDEPNSPTHHEEDFAKVVLRGILRGQEVARQARTSHRDLEEPRAQKVSNDRQAALEARMMAKHFGGGAAHKNTAYPTFRAPHKDLSAPSPRLDLAALLEHHGLDRTGRSKPPAEPKPFDPRRYRGNPIGQRPKMMSQTEFKMLSTVMGKTKALEKFRARMDQAKRWDRRRQALLDM